MANFNETIKATKSGRISVASYCDIVICKTMKEFQKAVCNYHMNNYFMCTESKNFDRSCRANHPVNEMETVFDYPYMEDNYQSLHIEYKSTHRHQQNRIIVVLALTIIHKIYKYHIDNRQKVWYTCPRNSRGVRLCYRHFIMNCGII